MFGSSARTSNMSAFIAYHSAEVMGYEYEHQPGDTFSFFSRKPRTFLEKAIGQWAWVITGVRGPDRRMVYRLAGFYIPSEVVTDGDGYVIRGERGTHLARPPEVTSLPWFSKLHRKQNKFSYGFNPIGDANIVDELQRLFDEHTTTTAAHGQQPIPLADEVATPSRFFEGATRQISVNVYERNPYARQRCIEHYGCRCAVCGFDFEAVYGELGRGYIHVHHLMPLSAIREEYEIDPIADLRPICPNCHAMIHQDTPMMSIKDLRARIQNHVTVRRKASRGPS